MTSGTPYAKPQQEQADCNSSVVATLIIPPLLKTSSPLLGLAMLRTAAERAGHRVEEIDLNALLRQRECTDLRLGSSRASPLVGDHDRPTEVLQEVLRRFVAATAAYLPQPAGLELERNPVLSMTYDHETVLQAALGLARGPEGIWMRSQLRTRPRPALVGLSILYSGQVLWGLAVSILVRELWPDALIVWGGPHVTALREEISQDSRHGALVDGFVFGCAERTFVRLLDAVSAGRPWPEEMVRAGEGRTPWALEDGDLAPQFRNLELYGSPQLTLPAQLSRGCPFARCRFCTYPAVEGKYRLLSMVSVEGVLAQARQLSAAVSFKDSLLLPDQLDDLAVLVGGTVRWSACTKLHPRLEGTLLSRLAAGGCATLEVGLETLAPADQRLIDKPQTLALLTSTLDAAQEAGIAVVVNYITGFPGSDPVEETMWLERVRSELACRPGLSSKLEHNTFQLERLSRLGRQPEAFGIQVVARWPWASVMAWQLEQVTVQSAA